jgi:AcrR family transcriptional regulator
MSELNTAPEKKRGRKLSFDRDVALVKATLVFWEHGYETTSVSDLIAAMNISTPSLYTAFGDKERLFLEVVERYADTEMRILNKTLREAATAQTAVRAVLDNAVIAYTRDDFPRGCMLVTAGISGSDSSQNVRSILAEYRNARREQMKRYLQHAVKFGQLSSDPCELAHFYSTVLEGLTIQARAGGSRQLLANIASRAMCAWPTRD